MTFDFFNTSNLAFGSKITSAFNTLEELAADAEANLAQVFEDQEFFDQYKNRNYQVPVPLRPEAPCRTDELFNFVNDSTVIKQLEYSNNTLKVRINLFDKASNRYTIASGETTLKRGYAYVIPSISNEDASKIITFTENKDALQGILLFQYRIDYANNINLIGNLPNLQLSANEYTQYKSLSIGSNITFPYTASENECICVIGKKNNLLVKLNNRKIIEGHGHDNVRHAILYLKEGDVVSGNLTSGFKIKYNT